MHSPLKGFQAQGFLRDYLDWAARQSDAPEEFHLFMGLTALGAAASRLRIPYGAARPAPTLWTVLVAPGAYYRKSTAMELGRRLLAEALPGSAPPAIYHGNRLRAPLRYGGNPERKAPGSGNPDRKAPRGKLAAVDDFSLLLAPAVAARLNELGDSEMAEGASRSTPLSLASTASPAVLSARLSADDIAAGSLARFSFVLAGDKTEWRALPGGRDAAAERALVQFLRNAARLEGEVSYDSSPAGLGRWGRTMVEWMNTMSAHRGHFWSAAGFASRLEITVLKLAVLLEISRPRGIENPRGALRVSSAAFSEARRLTYFLRWSFGRLLTMELPSAGKFRNELAVMMRIRQSPGITRRRLQRNSHLDAATLRQVIEKLGRNGHVRRQGSEFFPAESGGPEHALRAGETPLFAQKSANGHAPENAGLKE